jgi:hypothetical protein
MKRLRLFLSFLLGSGRVYLRRFDGTIGTLYGVSEWAQEINPVPGKPPQWRFYDSRGELLASFPLDEILSVHRKITTKSR